VLYLDASALVAAVTREPKTDVVLALMSRDEEFAISEWCVTEVASALATKVRTKQILSQDRDRARAGFEAAREQLTLLPVAARDFRLAAGFINDAPGPLRSGDALHLAIAGHHGATVVTLDRRMAEAANALGIAVEYL
jgi:predicted nucleic acid-binding protein